LFTTNVTPLNDMLDAIDKHGCTLEFLPPYSPDLNPIEKKWAQIKAIRRAKHWFLDELFSDHIPYSN
jgi:transposase